MATVIDIASRRVTGFALADHLRTELAADALANAVAARDPAAGVIFHSDRGCQPSSAAYAALAGDCQVTVRRPQGPVPLNRLMLVFVQVSDTPCPGSCWPGVITAGTSVPRADTV